MGIYSDLVYEMYHSGITAFGRLTRIQSTLWQLTEEQG